MIAKDDQINDQSNSKKIISFSQIINGIFSLLKFIKHIKLPDLFAELPDKRQSGKIEYSISSLALWAFCTCFFRQESKSKFHTCHNCTQKKITPLKRSSYKLSKY